MVFGIALVLVFAALVVALLVLRSGGPSMGDRLAALEESHGIEREQGALTKFVGDQQQKLLSSRFVEAGWDAMTPAKFILSSLGGAVAGFVVATFFVLLLHGGLMLQIGIGFVFSFGGFYFPTGRLEGAIKARKLAIARSMPDFLDLVSSTIEAGIALNGAIAVAADGMTGALADELRKILQDIRLGRSRSDALMAASSRVKQPNFGSTITAIVQADRLGGDIANVLEQLAMDARDYRLMRAEELANALPNKLVFPMALFMLPSLFVVIFGALVAHMTAPH
ncbi:MAG: type II secretion system F family protein [Candidatus Eremiobacteraeota bacterium]|nr:type II secretion system F family protein [Candidatus Eremiobacteraeota bacterium]